MISLKKKQNICWTIEKFVMGLCQTILTEVLHNLKLVV